MKRWIPAPSTSTQPHRNAVLGVALNAGERVQWAYTILPDGRRVATGYDIISPIIHRKRKKNTLRSAENTLTPDSSVPSHARTKAGARAGRVPVAAAR